MLTRCLPLQEEGDTREIRWHIDSLPQHSSSGLDRLVFNQDSTPDVITAVAASDSMLLVARASGTIVRYRCVCHTVRAVTRRGLRPSFSRAAACRALPRRASTP